MSRLAPYGECQRCGFKRRLDRLATEYTGLRVCRDTCLDPRPADHRPPVFKPEGIVVPGASPETIPIFREDAPSGGYFDSAYFDPAYFDIHTSGGAFDL